MSSEVEEPYHYLRCDEMERVKITFTEISSTDRISLATIGLSSKETIRRGMRAVDASPFKTVFVVNEESGKVLFALSKNEEYVTAARKKEPKPDPPPPPPPPSTSVCCDRCRRQGGYACDPYSDGSCICYGANRGDVGGGSLDDQLETLAF